MLENDIMHGVAYHNTFKTVFGLFPKEDKLIALDSVGANVWEKDSLRRTSKHLA